MRTKTRRIWHVTRGGHVLSSHRTKRAAWDITRILNEKAGFTFSRFTVRTRWPRLGHDMTGIHRTWEWM